MRFSEGSAKSCGGEKGGARLQHAEDYMTGQLNELPPPLSICLLEPGARPAGPPPPTPPRRRLLLLRAVARASLGRRWMGGRPRGLLRWCLPASPPPPPAAPSDSLLGPSVPDPLLYISDASVSVST